MTEERVEEKKQKDAAGLGKALTILHLEDKFLSNGELVNYPLVQRGKIANEIISEKLARGRWESVIEMMYGGFGKADPLYDGDRNQLREEIINSAVKHFDSNRVDTIIRILSKAGEDEILFNLATKLPTLKYESFLEIKRNISNNYFENTQDSDKKTKLLEEVQGQLAFAEGKYSDALFCFLKTGNQQGVDDFFKIISDKNRCTGFNVNTVEEAALSDPSKKESRLKKIIMALSRESSGSSNSLEALQLQRKYNIKLSGQEIEKLNEKVAKSLSEYNIDRELPEKESEIRLLWAKDNAIKEPRKAYEIFTKEKYTGQELNSAILSGLQMGKGSDQRYLNVQDLEKDKLKEIYPVAPFNVRADIARHLGDKKSLIKISKEAKKAGRLKDAYRLFVESGGNLQDEYIDGIRKKLINEEIKSPHGFFNFLDRSDKIGLTEAYNVLIESFGTKDISVLNEVHYIAKHLGNEKMLQKARKMMVEFSPSWALSNFKSSLSYDEVGADYALSEVANSTGVDKATLEALVGKYSKD